ncbi:hypothetical protein TruAng_001543 [Truncatella angustata]|nr:hypothetical protein TruAng_001543 [Truncatella angustata]
MAGFEDLFAQFCNQDKARPSGVHEERTFNGHCHCNRIQFNITLPTASLPLRSLLCHCSACRYTHGTFASSNVILPPGVEPQWINGSSRGDLKGYEKPGGRGERCQWSVAWGIFDDKFWQLSFHTFPKSAPGGGIVHWLSEVAGKEVLHLSSGTQDLPEECQQEIGSDGEERLRARCCCGGVSFTIPRPTQKIMDDDYMRKYVSPTDPNKWKAFLDLCRDCGRLSGTSVVPWLLVPRTALEPEVPPDLTLGSIKTYKSSEPTTRGFCGVCGATVFLATTDRMPTERQAILNVAMGVLRAPEGVTAGNWVSWRTAKVAWADDARRYDADFTNALLVGHEDWGIKTTGGTLDFAVMY